MWAVRGANNSGDNLIFKVLVTTSVACRTSASLSMTHDAIGYDDLYYK